MKQNNIFKLSLDSDAFGALKDDFDKVLTQTLMTMEQRESETAEMTVKLKIRLKKKTAPDYKEVRYPAERDIVVPVFEHKVSSVLQMKFEKYGLLAGDYELVWSENNGYYIRSVKDGQTSLFDGLPDNILPPDSEREE